MSKTYYSESIFYVDLHKYKMEDQQGKIISYRNGEARSIEVHISDQDRTIIIDGMKYLIYKNQDPNNLKYEVVYPNGHKYEVVDQAGQLMSYDEKGEWVLEVYLYADNKRILENGEEIYLPGSLVTIAYPEYHSKQGSLVLFVLSIVLLIYGWCGYRFRKFQSFLFTISLHWIWVQDSEPSDFYYFMCKVGGVIIMCGSVFLFLKSL
ncbi:hypothetical protein [Paenibacillus psychroresistens]|nr:hypothetical protein [Paenibacillus psychroresistens]